MVVLTVPDALFSNLTTGSYLKISWIQDTPALPVNVTLRRFVPPGSFLIALSIATGQSGDYVDWFIPAALEPDTYIINLESSVSGVGSRTFDIKNNPIKPSSPTNKVSSSSTSSTSSRNVKFSTTRGTTSSPVVTSSTPVSSFTSSLPPQVTSNAGSIGTGIEAEPSKTSSPSISANSNAGISAGIKAAIGTGAAALFLISIVLLGAMICLRQRHKQKSIRKSPMRESYENQSTMENSEPRAAARQQRQEPSVLEDISGRVELDGEKVPSEMAEVRMVRELDGGTATREFYTKKI